jgi:hypothetical protein
MGTFWVYMIFKWMQAKTINFETDVCVVHDGALYKYIYASEHQRDVSLKH